MNPYYYPVTSPHPPLSPDLRNQLAKVVLAARSVAEAAARHALEALTVDRSAPHKAMPLSEQGLRNRLRARGRQLGDHLDRRTRIQSKKRKQYPLEYRRRMIDLARSGRSPEALAREFEPSAPTIRKWVEQADLDEGRRDDGTTTRERDELRRLKRENKQLRLERDILKKAAAWFARESGSIPGEGSSS